MDEDLLLQALDAGAGTTGPLSGESRAELVAEVGRRAAAHQNGLQHWKAVSLLERARASLGPEPELDGRLALVLGGRAELLLRWADGLRVVPPPDLLSGLEVDLRRAAAIDPSLPDVRWDLAVVLARFRGDYEAADAALQSALALGFIHPLLPRLAALIAARPAPPPASETPEPRLRELLLRLADQAASPLHPLLDSEAPSEGPGPAAGHTFGDYLARAAAIAAGPELPQERLLALLEDAGGLEGDPAEYALDLLRRLAEIRGQGPLLDAATDRHLRLLSRMAFALFQRREQGAEWIRRSRRTADRALEIVSRTPAEVDPDVHADLLIARGQALYYQVPPLQLEAMYSYRDALPLKRAAGREADAARLKELLWSQIDQRIGRAMVATHIGGVGEALEGLRACAAVAAELEDPARAGSARLHLATLLRQLALREEAEGLLAELVREAPSEAIRGEAEVELASIYSETRRPAEAAALQRRLLEAPGIADDPAAATLWANYGNSLRLLGDLAGALAALETAWRLLPPEQRERVGSTVPARGAWVQALLAEVHLAADRPREALEHLRRAEVLWSAPHGLEGLHFARVKASTLLALARFDEALEVLDTAIHNFAFLLRQGPSLPTWESLLREWTLLDALAIRAALRGEGEHRFERGLLRAEAAKGRISAWLERAADPAAPERALAPERQTEALETVREWVGQGRGRCVVSLFGTDDGLALFLLGQDGKVTGGWIEDFDYGLFRGDVYEPWERLVDRALASGDPDLLALAGAQTEYQLDRMGGWLWRAAPALAAGGTELVILPHRLFRRLPLAHARLPRGDRLSDLFESVVIVPSLGVLGEGLRRGTAAGRADSVTALADADGTLPFARGEAVLSGAGERAGFGASVTREALTAAFGGAGTLLLSLHGAFDEEDPFRSVIFTADGPLPLHRLLLGQTHVGVSVVVLGVCEAGRARRSLVDEPIGFPAMLLSSGVAAVLAPAWKVDDFASFLYLTRLFESLGEGLPLPAGCREAARWLRELTAPRALERLDLLLARMEEHGAAGGATAAAIRARGGPYRGWLGGLDPRARPFRSPLDWAAFQLVGFAP